MINFTEVKHKFSTLSPGLTTNTTTSINIYLRKGIL